MIKITKRITTNYGQDSKSELFFNDLEDLFNWIIQWGTCPDARNVFLYDRENNRVDHLFSFTLNAETVTVVMVQDAKTNGIYFSDGVCTRGQTHMSETLLPYIEKAREELAKPIYNFI